MLLHFQSCANIILFIKRYTMITKLFSVIRIRNLRQFPEKKSNVKIIWISRA